MSEAENIANRILEVLQRRKRKSVYIRYTQKIGEVVLDFTNDMAALAINFIDTENRYRNQTDTYRLLHRLKRGLHDQDLSKIINLVLNRFTNEVKNNKANYIEDKLAKTTGKMFINATLINDLASIFSQKFIGKMSAGLIITTIYSIGGSVSSAIYTSERLSVVNYQVYNDLRTAGDLDLFYFLVEAYAGPFLDAISLKRRNPASWDEILLKLSNELSKK
ncbi:hypothetical protein LU604_05445 [Erwinia tracheiphila]|uniref:Uncharacterized protein n=1 Tax=Erwinia tracheiphila TaxID=65700 RepID=A0A345CTX2_9GAMM|nr:hypothetical protein [Erwinia tracheiphila]AXF76889.1 hypothetical protein AV903_13880 [Erwinia tracheiphila]UIA84429.1 hypothetical protein LU604_05445 [Erwinia tracheiphila]UIA93010.1 hypothetical protein LU632_05370 [Erwinia tracheiphila]